MTDLTDRMRTCAAHIVAKETRDEPYFKSELVKQVTLDAADLLLEASNELEQLHSTGALRIPADLGEPMELIPPPPPGFAIDRTPSPMWTAGDLPAVPQVTPRNSRACPKCDSRAQKKVIRSGAKLMLVCPVCSTQWEWKR